MSFWLESKNDCYKKLLYTEIPHKKRGEIWMKLSKRKVFSRYNLSSADRLGQLSWAIYKNTRLSLSKRFPLKPNEEYILRDPHFFKEFASLMPEGYNYINKCTEHGWLRLEYLDLFDYLPKELLSSFKRDYKNAVLKKGRPRFASHKTDDELDRLDNWGRLGDGSSFFNLGSINLENSKFLKDHCYHLSISIKNLSPTFLVVKYRLYIKPEFNKGLQNICETIYRGSTDIYRPFDTPWYKPWKFGQKIFDGNNIRERAFYEEIANLKWLAFKEVRESFALQFEKDNMFPPVFETYTTNIRPNQNRENLDFWDSVLFDQSTDYAPKYNACVSWGYKEGNNEGMRLAAYCGGKYTDHDHLSEIVQHEISDFYAVYMVTCAMRSNAIRDIAICNRKISTVIRKGKTSKILKTRDTVERKLYYGYRFVQEFSGESIDIDDIHEFRHEMLQKDDRCSITLSSFRNIASSVQENKKLIENILDLLNRAADYRSSKSNMSLQWGMLVFAVLSLVTAILALLATGDDLIETVNQILNLINQQ